MADKTKILYAVTKGDYLDYHICAITSDRKRAEELVKFYTDRYDEASIEEYFDGDPAVGDCSNLATVYAVNIRLTGACDAHFHGYKKQPFENEYVLNGFPGNNKLFKNGRDAEQYCVFCALVAAKDEEHAKKIVQDMYSKMKAEKEGL